VTAATLADRELLVIAEDSLGTEEGRAARDEGVTATDARKIASGSRKTWRGILDDKLNGSSFTGNAHTRRGHEREAIILAEARLLDGVVALAPSTALFGNWDHPLHRATPDGLGIHQHLGEFVAEVKSHDEGWDTDDIPPAHADQMQWAMHVTGFDWALYAWEVTGTPGIQHRWVSRDDNRIAQLVGQADAFLEWRAAGAPEIDDIPDDVDDALAEYEKGLALEAQGKTLKATARPILDEYAERMKAKPGEPLRKSGSRASLFFEPKPTVQVLDEEAWAAAEPALYAEWLDMKTRVAEAEAAAVVLYHQDKPVAGTFRVTPNGAKS
jgi:hypothetical protein